MENNKPTNEIQVELSEEMAQGTYANLVNLKGKEWVNISRIVSVNMVWEYVAYLLPKVFQSPI